MKRKAIVRNVIFVVFILSLAMIGFFATREPELDSQNDMNLDQPIVQLQYEYVEIEGVYRRVMPRGSLTIEHFLEDLDYMVYVLENNFALLDVAYWAHGVDYRELADNARASVLAMDEPCELTFFAIVYWYFYPMFSTGHFMVIAPNFFDAMYHNQFYGGYVGQKWTMNRQLLQSPLADRFYGQSNVTQAAVISALQDMTRTHTPTYNRLWGSIANPTPNMDERRVIIEKNIEEGRIAYIFPGTDMQMIQSEQHNIFAFFREIRDFDHLIIDMRGNGGGNANAFVDIIIRPFLTEAVYAPQTFHFFQDGPYVRRFGDRMFLSMPYGGYLTNLEDYRPANEILEDFELPEFHLPDLARLDYGVLSGRVSPRIYPSSSFMLDPDFNGQIWLLTDHMMGSAAQMAAWYSMELDFAIHVGDTTGGVFGGPRTMAFMPNTGILFYFDIFYIIDSRGKPLEAGTIPHHFKREGMDALETTLALIAEGNY